MEQQELIDSNIRRDFESLQEMNRFQAKRETAEEKLREFSQVCLAHAPTTFTMLNFYVYSGIGRTRC